MAQATEQNITKMADALNRGDVDDALQACGLSGAPGAVQLSPAAQKGTSRPDAEQGFAAAGEPKAATAACTAQGEGVSSRRHFMNMIVGSAAIASAAAVRPARAFAVDSGGDPVFAAIEQHRMALAAADSALAVTGRTNDPSPEAEAATDAAHAALDEAYDDLISMAPTTPAGAEAWLEYLATDADRQGVGFVIDAERFAALLRTAAKAA
jgi:hypothetical protein